MKRPMQQNASILSLLLALTLLLGACGGGSATPESGGSATPGAEVSATPAITQTAAPDGGNPGQTGVKDLPVPQGALDFADGNAGFLMADTSPADADPDTAFSVVDYNGAKALRITAPNGKAPYVAVDAAGLLGDRLADLRKIEARVTVDGDFYACSGGFLIYAGEDYAEDKAPVWSVFLASKNPNLAVAELDPDYLFVNGTKNYFVFYKGVDNGVAAGQPARDLLIDYIAFYDADGKIIPADSAAVFDPAPGFNQVDESFLTPVSVSQDFPGVTGTCDAWGQAVAMDTLKNEGGVFDPGWLEPGCIVTVYYSSASVPELILQSWTEGAPYTWAKVAPFAYNWSNNTAQYRYEDIVAAAGTDDLWGTLDKFYIGATFETLTVNKITIGKADPNGTASPLVSKPRLWDLAYTGESSGAWGQAVSVETDKSESGVFETANLIVPGCVAVVKYESEAVPELILQAYTDETIWAKVAAAYADEANGIAVYTYDDMVAAFGSDDFVGLMDKFNVGDCGAPLVVQGVQFRTD